MENKQYYSVKNWDKDSLYESINEIIDKINLENNDLKINDHLNQKLWNDDILDPIAKKLLIKNAIEFIKFAKLDKLNYNDIVLTGSMANYNWNDLSDIDVHIIMDVSEISKDEELVDEYLTTKRKLWSENINPKFDNHDIELYIEDIDEPHKSTGVYSILHDKWIKRPINQMISIDREVVIKKSNDILRAINNIINNEHTDKEKIIAIKLIFEKLKKYRQIGLNRIGEYSTENLVFKILRNKGVLKELVELKNELLHKTLSKNEI